MCLGYIVFLVLEGVEFFVVVSRFDVCEVDLFRRLGCEYYSDGYSNFFKFYGVF